MFEKLESLFGDNKENYYQNRIFYELKYAFMMSNSQGGKYDDLLRSVEADIISQSAKLGAITADIVSDAEKKLEEIGREAKKIEIICAAHAHIDMNWQWGWDETVGVVMDTVGTILQIMKEYPDFKFSQSQASIYKILADYAPEMLYEVKQRIHEGRWEVTAATWVESDKNMPNGESLTRQILYAKKYLSELLELDPDELNIDFEPDTFGHSIQVPEILCEAGIKYYYHCRGKKDGPQIYRWEGPSGAEILMNREPNFYFTNVDGDMAFHAFETALQSKISTTLRVYGVGDHGGGPTRRDIERLIDMAAWPVFPKFTLGTYKQFFEIIEKQKEKLPVLKGEINFIFDGCFSSQSRNKAGNKKAEADLYSSEVFSSIWSLDGGRYPAAEYEKAWQKVLLNQFHDIVTGSGVVDTRDYAMGLYQEVRAISDSKRKIALGKLAARIDTSSMSAENESRDIVSDAMRAMGAGAGSHQIERGTGKTRIFHVFNPSSLVREEVIEVLLWEWYGDVNRIRIEDVHGNEVPYQLEDKGYNVYWWHNYMKLLVKVSVPPFGYTTYKLSENPMMSVPVNYWWERRQQSEDQFLLENELIRVLLSPYDGSILSVIDKETGKEQIDKSRSSGVFRFILEANNKGISKWESEMSSWLVGRYKSIEIVNKNLEMRKDNGILRNSVTYKGAFSKSKLEVKVSLDKGERFLKYHVKCDWHEVGTEEAGVPQLAFYMPTSYQNTKYKCDVPFGMAERENAGLDIPANTMTEAFNLEGEEGMVLMSRDKYGYRCDQNSVSLVLLRSSFEPDLYPEYGICESDFAVGFYARKPQNHELARISQAYNINMTVLSDTAHKGELPLEKSYFEIVQGNAVVSTVKEPESAEGNEILIRLYEINGQADKTVICFDRPIRGAFLCDLNEINKGSLDDKIRNNSIEVELSPYKIKNIKLKF